MLPPSKVPSWGRLGAYKGGASWARAPPATMDPRPLPWALVLLSPALVLALGRPPAPEAPEKLCGHHFVRALVRVCGGPRWSPEAGRPVAGGDRKCGGQGLFRVSKWARGACGRRLGRVCTGPWESTCRLCGVFPVFPAGRTPGRGPGRETVWQAHSQVRLYHFSILIFMHFCINFNF